MPTLSVNRDQLFDLLGRVYSDEEFDQLCFDYGIELDEVTSEKELIEKERGDVNTSQASESIIYKIDIPANRYDLLCLEGLVQSLKVFLQQQIAPKIEVVLPSDNLKQKLIVTADTKKIRPFCIGAVLRNIDFTQEVYDSFIDLQDKLHQSIGRKRSLVAIGTHNLDTVQGPFIYDAKPPKDIKFKPLNQDKEYDASEMMELYSKDSHLKPYLPIIRDSPVYPVIYDQNGVVLSMPPIINGDHTKLKLGKHNVFIDVTGTELTKVKIALDTLVSMFSRYCDEPFKVELVEVVHPDGSAVHTPELPYRDEIIFADDLNRKIGVDLSAKEIANLLTKMCLQTEVIDEEIGKICVTIPPTRSDVIHVCDIIEDVAIAYGYNNIAKTLPRSMTIGGQQMPMKLSERLRIEMAGAGFTEALTFSLCSRADIGVKMRQCGQDMERLAVHISNPKTLEFQVVRTSLLPGLLKTIASNRKMPLPLKLFEIQEVVLKDEESESGARNERRLAAVHCNKTPGFEVLHGLLDRVMQVVEVRYNADDGYQLKAADDPSYLKARCAAIVYRGKTVGKVGVLHPEVIGNFDLVCPAAGLELNLEEFYVKS